MGRKSDSEKNLGKLSWEMEKTLGNYLGKLENVKFRKALILTSVFDKWGKIKNIVERNVRKVLIEAEKVKNS